MITQNQEHEVSDEILRRSMDRYSMIVIGAAHLYPFLGRGIHAMTPVPVPGLSKMCGGWAMDKYGRCYFDPEMVLGIGGEEYPLKTLIADFLHEVWHFLRQHPDRFENLALPMGVSRDSKRWNIAADAEINGSDTFLREHLQEWCVFPEKLKDGGGCTLPPNKTAEQYYMMLPEEEGEEPGKPPTGQGPPECFSDKPRPWELGEPDEDTPGVSDKQGESLRQSVAKEILESSRARGDVPYAWSGWAGCQIETAKIPWQTQLRRFAKHSMVITSGASNFTFTRRSRRQHMVRGGAVIPAVYHPKLEIAVVVDTSGSMSDSDLTRCLSEMSGIARAVGGSMFVVTGDTGASWSQRCTSVRQVEFNSRGGTDMRPLIAHAAKQSPSPHCIIVLTDGYTPWPNQRECRVPVMVGLLGSHCGEGAVPRWMSRLIIEGGE